MEQFTPHILPLDFRSRNYTKNNNLETIYNRKFTNNIKISTNYDISKDLGNTYIMMLNDEQDISKGYIDTNILNNYINRSYVNPSNLFADETKQNIKYNIYNATISDNSNMTDLAVFRYNKITPVKLIDKSHKYIINSESRQYNYLDYNFINKVF
jgi:hypothetical protein